MASEVLRLEDVGRGDVAIAGGKGANLGELTGKGFPVPDGFVVPAQACETFFQAIELERYVKTLHDAPHDVLEKQCADIRGRIEDAEIPADLTDAILAAHARLVQGRAPDMVCAVRSSATAEDLGDASFAGQHETYYYVKADELLKMIRHCWASLWSPEAVSYRTTQGVDHASVFMAVVVQEMILSEISGVTFTVHPVTGSRDDIVIESSWGMGAALVDGRVTPDHYIVEREGYRLREKRIAEKRFMVTPRLEQGMKGRLQEVPHGLRKKETLSPDLVKTVAEWSVKAEEHFGSPQDVEWSVTNGRFYMLQSRPVTVMGRKDITRDIKGKYVLFKALVENFTEPLTPLTEDLMAMEVPPGFRLIHGWGYTNLGLFKAVLPFKITDEELADLLYLSHGAQPPPMRISWIKLPVFLVFAFLEYLLFGILLTRTRRLPDDLMDGYRDLCREVEQDPGLGPQEALSRLWTFSWRRFLDPICRLVLPVNFLSIRYAFWMDVLKKLLRRWAPDLREDAEILLCSGSKGVLSAEMGRAIWDLAREAKRRKPVCERLEQHKPEQVLAELREEPEAKDFLDQLDRFLAVNGHRAMKEFELRSARWEENPAPVLGMIRNYLLVESNPAAHEEKVRETRSRLEEEVWRILETYPLEKAWGLRRRWIRFLVERVKYFTKLRENSRFYHIMAFSVVRKKILRIEAELMNEGKLRCKDDIFYLLCGEIAGMQKGELGWLDVEDRIRERRMEHIRLSKTVPPKTINIAVQAKPPTEETEDREALQGQSASPGAYEGTAHVILDPSVDLELKPGEILVAPYTDPAWTPLFLTAGAAVVEVGSYLSHAGTVAREFGMPCVVDVKDCTKRIQTGFRIKVDADRSLVRIIPEQGGEST